MISFSLLLGTLSNPNAALKALQSSSEVFPKQSTAGRLHCSYKSAVMLECVNRHISFLLLCDRSDYYKSLRILYGLARQLVALSSWFLQGIAPRNLETVWLNSMKNTGYRFCLSSPFLFSVQSSSMACILVPANFVYSPWHHPGH